MITFHLPDLGEGLKEAEIVAWHVGEGDHVVADQPLLSVETDKAVVEIPAPVSARVITLHAMTGDLLPTGAPLVDLESADAEHDTGTVVGVLPTHGEHDAAPPTNVVEHPARSAKPQVKASPAVRALAARLEVSLENVRSSGPHGTITQADVEHAAAPNKQANQNKAGRDDALRQADPNPDPKKTLQPMRGVRRAMSHNMAIAHAQVVPATLTDIADIDDWHEGEDITLRLIRAISCACADQQALNASYLGLEQGRRLNEHVDVGIAMDTESGLFVPVLRDVAQRSADDLRCAMAKMKADVRARRVPIAQLRGATITLSNFGMLGGLHASLVVMPPQVAIVGAGRVHERVVAVQGDVLVRRALPLSITFDHRAVMGSEAARFMVSMRASLSASS